jgi:hypothetical protein
MLALRVSISLRNSCDVSETAEVVAGPGIGSKGIEPAEDAFFVSFSCHFHVENVQILVACVCTTFVQILT